MRIPGTWESVKTVNIPHLGQARVIPDERLLMGQAEEEIIIPVNR